MVNSDTVHHGLARHSVTCHGTARNLCPPRRCPARPARVPWHSQYLMTAMFTGAVQVTMASPRSAAIAATTSGRPQAPLSRHECDRDLRRASPRHWSRAQHPVPNSQ